MVTTIKNTFLLAFFLCCSAACVHVSKSGNVKLYPSSREKTWKALIYIFKSYPIKTIDIEKGYIETKVLKGSKYWTAPHQKNINTNGLSAVIKAYLFYDKPYSKVEIRKTIFKQSTFFSDPEIVDSDFLEEKNILYRLKRELFIRKVFDKISN